MTLEMIGAVVFLLFTCLLGFFVIRRLVHLLLSFWNDGESLQLHHRTSAPFRTRFF